MDILEYIFEIRGTSQIPSLSASSPIPDSEYQIDQKTHHILSEMHHKIQIHLLSPTDT